MIKKDDIKIILEDQRTKVVPITAKVLKKGSDNTTLIIGQIPGDNESLVSVCLYLMFTIKVLFNG